MGSFANIFKHYKGLTGFRYSSGGDMLGRSQGTEISLLDEQTVLLTVSSSQGWWMRSSYTEYTVDYALLADIEKIFHRSGMKYWSEKLMRAMFVADGATYSYTFDFGEDRINLSSQLFPKRYSHKLQQIDEVIDTYMKSAKKLPGYETPEFTPEEAQEFDRPTNQRIALHIVSYYKKRLCFVLANGTDTDISVPNHISLQKVTTGEVLYEKSKQNSIEASAHDINEESVKLQELLEAGTYRLTLDSYSVNFEIK